MSGAKENVNHAKCMEKTSLQLLAEWTLLIAESVTKRFTKMLNCGMLSYPDETISFRHRNAKSLKGRDCISA